MSRANKKSRVRIILAALADGAGCELFRCGLCSTWLAPFHAASFSGGGRKPVKIVLEPIS